MKQIDPLEKQLQSWIPRRPSPNIQARLFGQERPHPILPSHLWNWLTPAAACVLTLLVALTGASHHPVNLDPATSFPVASLMYDPEASNTPRTFVLSRMDLNVEWNIWPRPIINSAHFPPATNRSPSGAEL
jgi:hypothetical protein